MERHEIIEKLKEICDNTLGKIPSDIENDTFDSLGLDTLDAVELSMEVEEHFGIAFTDEEWEEINSFKDIIEFIITETNKKAHK